MVSNYDEWVEGFRNHGSVRKSYSCIGTTVYTEPGNKQAISVILEWTDKEKMQQFGGSDELKSAMKHSGVVSPPDVSFSDTTIDVSSLAFQIKTDS